MEVTRRDLFKLSGLTAAGIVGAGALAGCAPKAPSDSAALSETGTAVVMLVLASTLMLLSEKDLASRWGIRLLETDDLAEEGRRAEAIAERCDAVTARYRLSPREDEICRLIAQGQTNPQIERELLIAPGTLKAHIQHIYVKCGVHSRKELVELCGGQ